MTENDNNASANEAAGSGNVVALPTAPKEKSYKKVANFVHEHPLMTVAGGLAVGALAAALLPKRNRAYIAKRTSLWADAVSAASVAIAQQALMRTEAAASQVRNHADALAGRAEHLGQVTIGGVEKFGEAASDKARSLLGRSRPEPTLAEKIVSAAGELRDRLHR